MRNPYVKLAVIVVIIGVAGFFVIRYILGLPTREERVVRNLMVEFKRGHYDRANDYCVDRSFFKAVDKSRVFDTDGAEIVWDRDSYEWNDEVLKFSVENYVKAYLGPIKFKRMSTQRLDNGASAVVHFLMEFTVNDYSEGSLLAPVVYHGTVEGNCFLKRGADGNMLVERFEVKLQSFEGMTLKTYLGRM
jgi:hypothetical protein